MFVRTLVASLTLLACSICGAAEPARLKIPELAHLQSKAVNSVDITVGPFMLWLAQKFAPETTDEGTEIKKVLDGIDAVYIRSYEFGEDHMYSAQDIEAVRSQLQQDQWKPLVEVRSKQNENVDIFVAIEDEKPVGFAIIASEPREFTIINVVGTIDPQHFRHFQASLGLPGSKVQTASLSD